MVQLAVPPGSMALKILLLEDDDATRAHIAKMLAAAQHVVDECRSGQDAVFMATTNQYTVLIVDRMVDWLDGLRAVRAMRAAGVATPVLFLTAMNGVHDRVEGLEAGGDDYLAKPFAAVELLARVTALARRQPMTDAVTRRVVADLELDLLKRTVTRAGRRLNLQPQEFKLLDYLMAHAGQIVTRTMLLENVWSFHFDPQTNVIESHISRLRAKVDRGFKNELIRTVRGSGYWIDDPGNAADGPNALD